MYSTLKISYFLYNNTPSFYIIAFHDKPLKALCTDPYLQSHQSYALMYENMEDTLTLANTDFQVQRFRSSYSKSSPSGRLHWCNPES